MPALAAILGLGPAERLTAQPFTTLYGFSAGANPQAALVLSGNALYGTASGGGAGSGTLFSLSTDGTRFTAVHTFTPTGTNSAGIYTNADGASPVAALVLSGNTLYGTASGGGSGGNGTVFAVNIDGSGFTTLHSFTPSSTNLLGSYTNSDGANPRGGLVLSGNTLYGTASGGGSAGNGAVFAVQIDGSGFTTLHSFSAGGYNASYYYTNSDGIDPVAGLILSGNTLYGTASSGGSSGIGTVFAVRLDGSGFTNLHSFAAGSRRRAYIGIEINTEGAYPEAGLMLLGNTLYGTALQGGTWGDGTVFAVSTDGSGFTNLYTFTGAGDGAFPRAGLILRGNSLCGTATGGSSAGNGTVFAVQIDGSGFATLHSFSAGGYDSSNGHTNNDGAYPSAGLVLAGHVLYGTAAWGGSSGGGALFGLPLPAGLEGQFGYATNNGASTVFGYYGLGGAVTIPGGLGGLPVTFIGDDAFENDLSLTGVVIPEGVIHIGAGTFQDCSNLTRVTIPSSVASIGDSAFAGTSLSGIFFQGNAPNFGGNPFEGHTNATVYYLAGTTGWGATYAGLPAFLWEPVSQLAYSTTNGAVAILGYTGTNEPVTLPGRINGLLVTSIGDSAFRGAPVTSVTIPEGITSIGANAFLDCTALTSVTVPSSVTSIGDGAFASTSLTGVFFQGNAPDYSVGNPFEGDNHATVYYLPGTRGWGATYAWLPAFLWDPYSQMAYTTTSGAISIQGYTGTGGPVTLPGSLDGLPVTSIGDSAFRGAPVTSVAIPDSITSVGDAAFADCTNLTNLTLGNGVVTVGDAAFSNCTALASLTIPQSVRSLGTDAFGACYALRSIYFVGNAPSISGSLFGNDQNTVVYHVPGTTGWGPAFAGLPAFPWDPESEMAWTISWGAISIERYTGPGGAVTIPETLAGLPVTEVGGYAFSGTSVASVVIPDSVGIIRNAAFSSCGSLTNVTIGKGVTIMAPDAFSGCTNLTAITVSALNPAYGSADGVLLDKGQTTVIQCPQAKTSYTVPNSVTTIAASAFYDCTRLAGLTFGNSVTTIGNSAFEGCSALTNAAIPNSVITIGDSAFYQCISLTNLTIGTSVTSIGEDAFANCYDLARLTIGSRVTNIANEAFSWCTKLTDVTIPDSATSIGNSSFSACFSLASVTLGKGVTNIGASAFAGCTNLTAITVSDLNPTYSSVGGVLFDKSQNTLILCPEGRAGNYTIPYRVTRIGDSAFQWCSGLASVTIPDSVRSIGDWAFAGTGLISLSIPDSVAGIGTDAFYGCSSLTNLTLAKGVTNIGDWAFQNCYSLATITIPGSVTNIGNGTFSGCTNLISITIPNGVTSIGNGAFGGSGLTSVTIPGSVTSLGAGVFSWCISLTNVTIPNSITSISNQMFWGCSNLTSLTIPEGVTSLGDSAFQNCSSLAGIAIPDSVTSIGYATFGGCASLTSLTIPDSVTTIGDWAFSSCASLTNVTIGNGVTNLGINALSGCGSLTSVYFRGNAPSTSGDLFQWYNRATAYYLPGATGFGPTFAGFPAVLWKPVVQTTAAGFGAGTNGFGFTINWASGTVIVVEASTNLANPAWYPLGTNTLTSGAFYFSDPQWTNYPARFYRIQSP